MKYSSNTTKWTDEHGAYGAQRLRIDIQFHIGEDRQYYKVNK